MDSFCAYSNKCNWPVIEASKLPGLQEATQSHNDLSPHTTEQHNHCMHREQKAIKLLDQNTSSAVD